jgi:hypothetical protein
MALNKIFQGSPERNRDRALSTITNPSVAPTSIQPGVPVTFADGPAVSLTASGNATKTEAQNLALGLTSITYGNGGVGNASGHATFAFDGTYEFAVTGATTSTADGVEVFITTAGALTLTSSTNAHFGWTDYPVGYEKESGRAPVRIGA